MDERDRIHAETEEIHTEGIPAEEPVTEAVEAPAEEPIPETAESTAEEPAAEAETSSEEAAPAAEEIPVEEPVSEPEEIPAEEPAVETTEGPAEEPAAEAEETPAEETAPAVEEIPAEESVEEPEEIPAEEPAVEATEGPEAEAEETPVEEPAPETAENPSEETPAEETPSEEPSPETGAGPAGDDPSPAEPAGPQPPAAPPKKKGLPIRRILLALLVLLMIGGGVWFWQFSQNAREAGRFLYATSVNGVNVAGLTPDQAAESIRSDAARSKIILTEKGKRVLEGTLGEYGYVLDEESLTKQYEDILESQLSDYLQILRSLFMSTDYPMESPVFTRDQTVFDKKVCAASLSEERVSAKDAYLDYDAASKKVAIVPEVLGTEFADRDLQNFVRDQIEALTAAEGTDWKLETAIPEEIYIQPAVFSDNEDLVKEEEALNAYAGSDITYEFGKETEHLGFDILWTWFTVENGKAVLDPVKPEAYVQDLEAKYNTRYLTRVFKTTYGTEVEFRPGRNEYGYTIRHDDEIEQLKKDILSGKAVSREPLYYEKNSWGNPLYLKRNGTDDMGGTYVECNLSAQHLWYYIDGELFLESDFVSGNIAKDRGTATGVFPLAYKESPSVLTGGNAEEGEYETKVTYWMPFYEGQGLHDATWRSYFGGNIYKTNGSHGCINLPLWAAQTIYNNITPGTALVIYY